MRNDSFAKSAAIKSPLSSQAGRYSSFAGVNTTRQDKFQAREQRRWGDGAYWDIPAPVVWLEDPFLLSPLEDVLFGAPVFVDIWG